MKEFPRRFLSLRDKNGAHRRSRSNPPSAKSRTSPTDSLLSIFKPDYAKSSAHGHAENLGDQDATAHKVQNLLEERSISGISIEHIRDILSTLSVNGNTKEAVDFIDLEQKAFSGVLTRYNPNVHMLGAENRQGVTCYLDSLLFAMFARVDAFESVLKHDFDSADPRHKLVNLLRMWVNMLRSGKLIRTDLTKLIQEALAECGWPAALEAEQQDTSEAFAFITEILKLPLLPLQMDLFHHGNKDADDHKIVYERMLNVAVPPEQEKSSIKLEDCLEIYLNTKVDVLRNSEVARKSTISEDRPLPERSQTEPRLSGSTSPLSWTNGDMIASPTTQGPKSPLAQASSSVSPSQVTFAASQTSGISDTMGSDSVTPSRQSPTRARSSSLIQSVVIDEQGKSLNGEHDSASPRAKRKGSTIVKAVTIPAWQFFRLIPWNANQPGNENGPSTNQEVFLNFDERPIVNVCLKRYMVNEKGKAIRHDTYIDVPESMRLPHFMMANDDVTEDEAMRLSSEYKLILQAAICHRGFDLSSGHYYTYARMAPKLLTSNRRHKFDPPPDYEEDRWVLFDDLLDQKVSYIPDLKEALKKNMPYMLFYQIVPMMDSSASDTDQEPPSYMDVRTSSEFPPTSLGYEGATHGHSRTKLSDETYFTDARSEAFGERNASKPPSIRFSAEWDEPRKSSDAAASYTALSEGNQSRRPSTYLTDSTNGTPAISPAATPSGQSPLMQAVDESSGSRLSRAASRFTRARAVASRPVSQSGDNRLSVTMNRLSVLMKPSSKEPMAEPPGLNIDATSSNGSGINVIPESTPSNANIDAPGEKEKGQGQDESHLTIQDEQAKKGHKRGKSRDKHRQGKEKHKGGEEQPDRECLLM